ncbi:MAG: energy-coupling factor ABC transporter substrate-binding protein [Acidobacteriota bacterium]|nr:energy-coupling factor ABC transporter substrate-binding protein [Acidobacteriota bacterium]
MKNTLLLLAALTLLVAPFALYGSGASEFAGTDDQAEATIREVRPEYQPWFRSLFEPDETGERRLFNLQAVCGLTVLGYCLFKLRQRNRNGNPHASETR